MVGIGCAPKSYLPILLSSYTPIVRLAHPFIRSSIHLTAFPPSSHDILTLSAPSLFLYMLPTYLLVTEY